MGDVFEALDRERGARIALKTMRNGDPANLCRFTNEFRALADVLHPNLVALHELLTHEGVTFFTMDLVEGVDLLAHVRPPPDAQPARAAFDEPRLRDAIRQLALGVEALHAA